MLPFKNPRFYNREGTNGWSFFMQISIAVLIVWISTFMGFHTSYHSSSENDIIPKNMIASATSNKKIALFNHELAKVSVDNNYLPSLDQYINNHNKPEFIYRSFDQTNTKNLLFQIIQMSTKKKIDQNQFNDMVAPTVNQIVNKSWQNISIKHDVPGNEVSKYKIDLKKLISDNGYGIYSSYYNPINFNSGVKIKTSFKILITLTVFIIVTSILIADNKFYVMERLAEVTSFSSIAAMAIIFINIHKTQLKSFPSITFTETFQKLNTSTLISAMLPMILILLISLIIIIGIKLKLDLKYNFHQKNRYSFK